MTPEPAPTRKDLIDELARLLAEGARLVLERREREQQDQPSATANSRIESR